MSSQQVSESTFASIVEIPSYMQPWPIFNEMLRAKVWGKNMADEEQQWLNAQQASPTMGSEFGLRDQEGEERIDEATTMDPDDDIISGCDMLDIGIDGLKFSNLWIRAEYMFSILLTLIMTNPRRRLGHPV